MKILYAQDRESCDNSIFSDINIKNSILKKHVYEIDYKTMILKSHYHLEYEIHMVFSGNQLYEVDGEEYEINENEFIIIPPGVNHRMISSTENLVKYAITFNCVGSMKEAVCKASVPPVVTGNIDFICEEFSKKLVHSRILIENRLFESFVLLLRTAGYIDEIGDASVYQNDIRIGMAKKFIADNLENNLSVRDVANYCHICERQLTRNFISVEGIPPAKYISNEKMKKIGEYVKYSDLSVKQISEKFSYSSDCYFNNAFKKHFGMTPYAYRKMFR